MSIRWFVERGRVSIKRQEERKYLLQFFLMAKRFDARYHKISIGNKRISFPCFHAIVPPSVKRRPINGIFQFLPRGTMFVPLEIKYWKVINFTRIIEIVFSDRIPTIPLIRTRFIVLLSLPSFVSCTQEETSIEYYSERNSISYWFYVLMAIKRVRRIILIVRGNNFPSIILYELILYGMISN